MGLMYLDVPVNGKNMILPLKGFNMRYSRCVTLLHTAKTVSEKRGLNKNSRFSKKRKSLVTTIIFLLKNFFHSIIFLVRQKKDNFFLNKGLLLS